MNTKLTQKIEELIVKLELNCSVSKFANRVNWYYISRYQKLDNDLIREFSDRVDWDAISHYQKLDNDIIREFADKLNWRGISRYQKLDNDLIRGFSDRVDWDDISHYQKLDNDIIREFSDRVDIEVQLKKHHAEKSNSAVYDYAKKHGLRIEDGYLYAFRNHDQFGRGAFNKTIFYEKGGVYKDWHCDLDPDEENSFGLGIWPEGNTPIRVKLNDFGVEVRNDGNGKARVWGFEVL